MKQLTNEQIIDGMSDELMQLQIKSKNLRSGYVPVGENVLPCVEKQIDAILEYIEAMSQAVRVCVEGEG